MRTREGLVLAAVPAMLAILALSSPSLACTCAPPGTATQSLAASDAVFVGTVLESVAIGERKEDLLVVLSVQRSWKGITTAEVELHTPAFSSLCGVEGLEKGEEFLVYARATPEGKLSTDLCTRTRPVARAQDDLVELGPSTLVAIERSTFGNVKGHFDR